MTQKTIGFIGYGNMAQAIASGLIKQGNITSKQIYACAKHWDSLFANATRDGVHACHSAKEVIEQADIICVAVKPKDIEEVLKPLTPLLKNKICISIVAGYPYAKLLFIGDIPIISIIPNLSVAIGEGIWICEKEHSLSIEQYALVKDLFQPIGMWYEADGSLLSIAGTIAGCTPAFVSLFIEALADGGVYCGLPREDAYQLVTQMLLGASKLHASTMGHPGAIKDRVCSPGGTTIRGVTSLEKNGFRSSVIEAIKDIEQK